MERKFRESAKLTAYALGQLDRREAARWERAAASCDETADAIDETLEVASLLQDHFGAEPEYFLTQAQREAVVEGSGSETGRTPGEGEAGAGTGVGVATVGACGSPRGTEAAARVPGGKGKAMGFPGWVASAAAAAAAVAVTASMLRETGRGGDGERVAVPGDGGGGRPGATADAGSRPVAEAAAFDPLGPGAETSPLLPQVVPVVPSLIGGEPVAGETGGLLEPDGDGWRFSVDPAEGDGAPGLLAGDGTDALQRQGLTVSPVGGLVSTPGAAGPLRLMKPGVAAGIGRAPWSGSLAAVPAGPVSAALPPGASGPIGEGGYSEALGQPVSRFPLVADPGVYANLRHFVMAYSTLPPADLVSIGDLVNYFPYEYEAPLSEPVGIDLEVAECPWAPERLIARVGLSASRLADAPQTRNVVLLVDTSPSMSVATKLPILVDSVDALLGSLGAGGQVAVVPFGGSFSKVFAPAPAGDRRRIVGILEAFATGIGDADRGLALGEAVQVAGSLFRGRGGLDRAVVVTDSLAGRALAGAGGGFAAELAPLGRAARAGVALFGLGPDLLGSPEEVRSVARTWDFSYVGSVAEGRKVFAELGAEKPARFAARGVTAEIEFNPLKVRAYRLLAAEGDAAVVGSEVEPVDLRAGHQATALYEIIPTGGEFGLYASPARRLKYGHVADGFREVARSSRERVDSEWFTVRVSYRAPLAPGEAGGGSGQPRQVEMSFGGTPRPASDMSRETRFAAAVAGYGILASGFSHPGSLDLDGIIQLADGAVGDDRLRLRLEFLELVRATRWLPR